VSDNPNQTILTFSTVEGYGMVLVTTKYDNASCRKAVSLFLVSDEQPFKVVEGEGFKYLCKKAVSLFLVLDEQPFKAVEGEGFKYLCQTFQPQFVFTSRSTIAKDCFRFFMDEIQKLKAFFKSDCNRVALTTDC
jgi:hypothetical protein